MKVTECDNQADWDDFLLKQENPSFLQSWQWGEFQRLAGKKPLRLCAVEGDEPVAQMQGFEHKLAPGLRYLYVPRLQTSDFSLQSLVKHFTRSKYVFIRIEPGSGNLKLSEVRSPKSETINRQPSNTLILDINIDEDKLLSVMHPKTRYNIRLAERKGVVVKEEKNIDIFWRLNEETTSRDKFKSHGKEYYDKMLENEISHQLIAYYNEKPIASNILIKFTETATYLHGASSNESRNLMVPYLLQWEGIKLAKKMGCKYYDFWGVAGLKKQDINFKKQITTFHNYSWDVNDKWTGITRFKAGFGGRPNSYGQAVDVVLKPLHYTLYTYAKKFL